ncbi:MAG TPA: hypothetical protein VFH58_02590 [Acidimicrobiales bacterium]|nr:hypothetical protein [Acidimicrobiales bacterium]
MPEIPAGDDRPRQLLEQMVEHGRLSGVSDRALLVLTVALVVMTAAILALTVVLVLR